MDGSRFDAWTRRRLGLVAGSLVTAALGGLHMGDVEAKNKHQKHKQRCLKLGEVCTPGGTQMLHTSSPAIQPRAVPAVAGNTTRPAPWPPIAAAATVTEGFASRYWCRCQGAGCRVMRVMG